MNDSAWFHICVDLQRMFHEDTPWRVPWMERIVPRVEEVVERFADRTLFTRFVPPDRPEEMAGAWQDYYRKWPEMLGASMPKEMFGLARPLSRFVPPAHVLDKRVYSPWHDGRLASIFRARQVRKLVVSGGETDVCVLATVMGAIDHGFEVAILSDCLCSSADETHDAGVKLLASRFSVQVEMISADDLLSGYE